jgi:hypothetical protein
MNVIRLRGDAIDHANPKSNFNDTQKSRMHLFQWANNLNERNCFVIIVTGNNSLDTESAEKSTNND